jgi:Protein of unknown function (DUF3025)
MRFVAPAWESIDPAIFSRPPLSSWGEFSALLRGADWPGLAVLNACRNKVQDAANCTLPHFTEQTPQLLLDGLHYESRIAELGLVATRERNWHDLLNALIWLRYPTLKAALNARQVAEIALIGAKQRTRAQYALTHFDEAGVIVQISDPQLLKLWDAHDWPGLFWRERQAWRDGSIRVEVFGHALLEHALKPGVLFVGKALVMSLREDSDPAATRIAATVRAGKLLNDPLELRPLPLSGIPGWHDDNESEKFYTETPCFRPLREGRAYPPLFVDGEGQGDRGRG